MRRVFFGLIVTALFSIPVLAQDEIEPPEDDTESSADQSGELMLMRSDSQDSGYIAPRSPLEVGRMPTLRGHTGLFHIITADSTPPETAALGLFGEYFSGTDVIRAGDEDSRFVGRLTLAYTVNEFFEASLGLAGNGNVNTFAEPELIQSQGDLMLGCKGFSPIADGLSGGASLGLFFLNGENSVGVDFSATSADFRGLLSYSFVETTNTPVVLHFNAGFFLDNSPELFSIESETTSETYILELQRVERFAHQVSDYHLIELGLGVEVPVEYATPFLEWNLGIPVGGDSLQNCETGLIRCPSDVGIASFPDILTLGVRARPLPGLALNLGVDISLTSDEAAGIPATAPYNVIFGLSYVVDPRTEGRDEYASLDTGANAGPVAWILGEVVDDQTGEPIDGALVSYPGTDFTPQSTESTTGRFRSYDFPEDSEVELVVTHPLYESRSFVRELDEGEDGIRIRLEPGLSVAVVSGVLMAADGEPLPANIYLDGPSIRDLEVDQGTGEYEVQLEPGEYTIMAVADGPVTARDEVTLAIGRVEWSPSMVALAEGNVAVLHSTGIFIAGDRVTFVDDGTELEARSEEILTQVADLLRQYPELRVQVIAHTDDNGSLEQTDRQAQIVVDFLTAQDIAQDRLEGAGVGDTRPLFPNISNRNRRRNRRVEFRFPE